MKIKSKVKSIVAGLAMTTMILTGSAFAGMGYSSNYNMGGYEAELASQPGMSEANALYQRGDFYRAAQLYKAVFNANMRNYLAAYSLSRSLAQLGDLDRAIYALNMAAWMGFTDVDFISRDPALAPLRSREYRRRYRDALETAREGGIPELERQMESHRRRLDDIERRYPR